MSLQNLGDNPTPGDIRSCNPHVLVSAFITTSALTCFCHCSMYFCPALQILGDTPTPDDIKSGRVTPMFFGSAFNNFGVDLFLQSFISMAVAPGPAIAKGNPAVLQPLTAEQLMERKQASQAASTSARTTTSSSNGSSSKKGSAAKGGSTGSSSVDGVVPPDSQHFSGLVFKLQANMDPKHRDKVGDASWPCSACTCSTVISGGLRSASCIALKWNKSRHMQQRIARDKQCPPTLNAGFELYVSVAVHGGCLLLFPVVQVAFVRVVSGKFEKGMKVKVARSGRVVTLARPSQMFAQSRATVQEGFAGKSCHRLSAHTTPYEW